MEFKTNIEKTWLEEAKKQHKSIVLPEAGYSKRIVLAGIECAKEEIADIIFLVKNDNELDEYNVKDMKNIKVINNQVENVIDKLI